MGRAALVLPLALAIMAWTACAPSVPRLPASTAGAPDPLLLVSVSGLGGAAIEGEMPTLAALARAGALSTRVEGVAPASTLPAHATLVTGVAPAVHGVVADHRLGEHGVRAALYNHASLLEHATLWQLAFESGGRVASLDWPTTLGAAIPLLLPDVEPQRDVTWPQQLRGDATPRLLELVREHGGDVVGAEQPGAERDAVLTEVACDLLAQPGSPRLLLLRLAGPASALAQHGPGSPAAAAAYAAVDRKLTRLLDCLGRAGTLGSSAVVVVGDHGVAPVHTQIAPNAELARAGLLAPEGQGVSAWSAVVRSNGGSAFVYARDEQSALRARDVLEKAARDSGAFRVVSAEEMIEVRADTDAWFGLEAEPGFAFADAVVGPLLSPSIRRGAGGYLPSRREMDAAFVAWGRGIRPGLRIPAMRETDVAPTLARLLGLELKGASGRVLVGLLQAGPLRARRPAGIAGESAVER